MLAGVMGHEAPETLGLQVRRYFGMALHCKALLDNYILDRSLAELFISQWASLDSTEEAYQREKWVLRSLDTFVSACNGSARCPQTRAVYFLDSFHIMLLASLLRMEIYVFHLADKMSWDVGLSHAFTCSNPVFKTCILFNNHNHYTALLARDGR